MMKMKIKTVKNMVEFGPSVKTFNGESLKRGSSVDTNNAILIRLIFFYLYYWPLQYNIITPETQRIQTKNIIISIKD